MKARARSKKGQWGFSLVLLGLLLELGAAFFWTPGTFVLSAAFAVPLVALGVGLLGLEALAITRAERADRSRGDAE